MIPFSPMKVVIANESALRSFRKRARASDEEILGTLVGRVNVGDMRVTIEDIAYPTIFEATEMGVVYNVAELITTPGAVGTIHSHPNIPAEEFLHLSDADMKSQAKHGEVVFAVYSYWFGDDGKCRARLKWYAGSPAVVVKRQRKGTSAR
jgi:proteasome lid subunit RPN8/RPN11